MEDKKNNYKKFRLSNIAIDNKTSVLVLLFIIIFTGITSYTSMPRESFPEVVIPTIYVGTVHPGNSPEDIEKLITRPLEKEINAINGVNKITSNSIQDYSTIMVEFDFDYEVSEALQKVKDAVDKAKSELPTDLDNDPNVLELDFSSMPVMNLNLTGDIELSKLREYAEKLQDEIEGLSEISQVNLSGTLEREIKINVDLQKMQAFPGLSFDDIQRSVASENLTISAGDLEQGEFNKNFKINGEIKDPKELENFIIKSDKGEPIFLYQIAEVIDGFEDHNSYARADGKNVVSLAVVKRGGENLLEAAEKISQIIEDARESYLPENVSLSITGDQSTQTKNLVNDLQNSIISGLILVVLVLLFFMGARNAMFVGVAIPLSMFISFIILSAADVTLNMMVLFSLILALGMLVDNGIVVIENIYRLLEEGHSHIYAAKRGIGEVAIPIIASTLTTLAAFFPLLFWDALMGEFMKYLPITLITTLSASLFVGLIINPTLAAYYMHVKGEEKKPTNIKKTILWYSLAVSFAIFFYIKGNILMGNLISLSILILLLNKFVLSPGSDWFQNVILPIMEKIYYKSIKFVLHRYNSIITLGGTVGMLFVSFMLFSAFPPKIEFMPSSDPQFIYIYTTMPIGTNIEVTDSVTNELEKIVFSVLGTNNEDVEAVLANVGANSGDPRQADMSVTPHKSRISIAFVEFKYRKNGSTKKYMNEIRKKIEGKFPGAEISVEQDAKGPPVGKPVNIEISGDNIDTLINLAKTVKQEIDQSDIEGIEELQADMNKNLKQIILDIDREAARREGLSTAQIGMALRTALYGQEVSKYKVGEDEYPIMVRLNEKYRYDLEALKEMKISFRDMLTGKIRSIPISTVANVYEAQTYNLIPRKDLKRVITLSSNVLDGYNATEINNQIKNLFSDYEMPEGYELKLTGEQEEQAKASSFLANAMLIAVFIIFLILVSQFNSVIKPFIIIAAVVLSLIGVLLGLVIFKMTFSVLMSGIGIISLAGIVVNNAIVLIDYIDLYRKELLEKYGVEELSIYQIKEAIIHGGSTRLRPVLLTATTTVLGLIPLAIGFNFDFIGLLNNFDPDIFIGGDNASFWGPMAWAVIFGLTFATFLTLIVVPAMYYLAYRLFERKITFGKRK